MTPSIAIAGAFVARAANACLRQRGERLKRPCAHLYETGRMRRVHLRSHDNILKRLLIHAGALNLGLLMRQLFGIGTPRSLQGRAVALLHALGRLFNSCRRHPAAVRTFCRRWMSLGDHSPLVLNIN